MWGALMVAPQPMPWGASRYANCLRGGEAGREKRLADRRGWQVGRGLGEAGG
jgi:hypothetical protein